MLDVGATATAKTTAGPTPPRSRFRPPHRPLSPAYAPASVGSFLARLPPPGAAPRRARHWRYLRAYRSGGRRDGRSGLSPSTVRRRRETLEPTERTPNCSPGEDCFPLLGKLVRSLSGTMSRVGSKTTEFEGIYHLKSRLLWGLHSISEVIQASKRRRGSFEGRRAFQWISEQEHRATRRCCPRPFHQCAPEEWRRQGEGTYLDASILPEKSPFGGGGWLERIGAEHPDARGALPSVGVHRSRNFSLQRSPGKGERRGIPFKNEDIPSRKREYPRKSLIYFPRTQRVFRFPPIPLRKSKG